MGGTGAQACLGGTEIYSSAAGFKDLILSAYAKAGQDPWIEGQPNPTLGKLGATCASDGDCGSNMCRLDPRVCTVDCASAACPSGFSCNGDKLCAPESSSAGGGCRATGRSTGGLGLVAVAIAAMIVRARRKCG
jgi:hypothetical protein